MTDQLHFGNETPWTGRWRDRLQSELDRTGFDSLEEFLEAHPGMSYVALARQMAGANIAPIQIFGEQVQLGMAKRSLRSVAMDSLVRYLNQDVPRGWRNGVHFQLRAASAFADWSTGFLNCEHETINLSQRFHNVFDALKAMPIPAGWLPKDVQDPFVVAAFAAGWPEQE
jgi:hypothetical protein